MRDVRIAEAEPRLRGEGERSDRELLAEFVRSRHEQSFRALVERHGPMVLAVCRRVLGDRHAAEDVFQATFLVLVRKAAGLTQPELLGKWLYGVAYRLAAKARVAAARRRSQERQAAIMALGEPELESAWRELHQVLDEELNQLPEKYRTPLVLCYLQGKTNEQAAELLGCPLGSMSWRLAQSRERLRKRLQRRGLFVTAGLLLLLLALESGVEVSARLLERTVQAGVASALGDLAAAGASSNALSLTQAGLREMSARPLVVQLILAGLLITLLFSGLALVYGKPGRSWWSDSGTRSKATEAQGPSKHCREPQGAQP